MANVIKLHKGLNINLKGKAAQEIFTVNAPDTYALVPDDFHGVTPKVVVKEQENVKAGDALFVDKNHPEVKFVSPVSGTVTAVTRGERRKVLSITVAAAKAQEYVEFGKKEVSKMSGAEVKAALMEAGLFAFFKQRPYDVTANPSDAPKAIFVSAFNSMPLSADFEYVLYGREADFQTGLDALSRIAPVHLGICACQKSAALNVAKNVTTTIFKGPHPAGNVSTQLNVLSPINKGETVWYTYAQNLVAIGNLFINGTYDSNRVVAFTGSEVKDPAYYQTRIGADMSGLYDGIVSENVRIISGNVLTGKKINGDNFLGFYDTQITVIPEGDHYQLFGWLAPNFKKFTSTNTMGASLCKKSSKVLDTNLNGGIRPLIMTGNFEKVFPFDIYPMQLIKACIIKDIDQMEELGIYEIDAEDFALCEVIDPSKTPIQQIIREGLELLRKEMN